ncbi:hypothetical protein J6590_088639 [Homalodisca vitripennis]|nr:hypothetical protein J6590_088639 [Homalodisca vitripennis]
MVVGSLIGTFLGAGVLFLVGALPVTCPTARWRPSLTEQPKRRRSTNREVYSEKDSDAAYLSKAAESIADWAEPFADDIHMRFPVEMGVQIQPKKFCGRKMLQ